MLKDFPMLRKAIIMLGDAILLVGSAYLAFLLVYRHNAPIDMAEGWRKMVILMLCTGIILLNVHGLFSLSKKKFSELIITIIVALINCYVIILAVSFLLRDFTYSRTVLLITFIFQLIFLSIWKYLFWRIEHALSIANDVLVIGSKQECSSLVAKLQGQKYLNYNVRYVCTDCDNGSWQKAAKDVDLLIIGPSIDVGVKAEIVHFCHINGKRVLLVPDFYTIFVNSAEVDKIDDIPVLCAKYLEPTVEQRILKRALDLLVSGFALLVLWPLFIIIAALIKVDSPGPVLYSQVRVGRKGKEFKLVKFRTMCKDAELKTGPVLSCENDPRITKVGKFLRATRLDELPQLFNVLVGDMSIVGPRPERPYRS